MLIRKKMSVALTLLSVLFCVSSSQAVAETKTFEETAVLKNGTKYWLLKDPKNNKATLPKNEIRVKKGDLVKIHLSNTITGPNNIHGFKIEGYPVEALVENKGADVEFVADKAGEFKIFCHLHPKHVGGTLIVEN